MATLEITTMIGCPLKCTFCPQTGLKEAYTNTNESNIKEIKYLTFENFSKILAKVPKHVRIDFSGMAEPWANPECTAMLRHALESGFSVAIFTTLYDMTEKDCDLVLSLLEKYRDQVEMLYLHLPDANGNMRGWKHFPEWENILVKFMSFGKENIIKRFRMMTMDGSGKVHSSLKHLNINLRSWSGLSRAGSLDPNAIKDQSFYTPQPRHEGQVFCSATPFYDHNVLLPNGDVVLCCMDYNLKHIIGNLLEQNYYEMFLGDMLNNIRAENMKPGYSDCSICKSCDAAKNYTFIHEKPIETNTLKNVFSKVKSVIKSNG